MSEAEEEIASAFSFPDLPTVEQQIRAIEAPIQARYADEIALDPEVVDEILRTGSNRSKGQLRLIYNFMVEKTPEEYTEFVKNEYATHCGREHRKGRHDCQCVFVMGGCEQPHP